jgi:hypothetical protein
MLFISLFVYSIAGIWFLIFLARVRDEATPLPNTVGVTPDYVLWLPDGMSQPDLEPAPTAVVHGAQPPSSNGFILRLAGEVRVPTNLASRCSATGHDFVSVMPRPNGNLSSLLCERMRRDFAQPAWVNDIQNPAAYVDQRCVWFKGSDLNLPSSEACDVFRVGRARKAHGLAVGLYSGYELGDESRQITADGVDWTGLIADLSDWYRPQPLLRWVLPIVSLFLWGIPLLALCIPELRDAASLALFLGLSQRLCSALYDGFSLPLVLLSPFTEPAFWIQCARIESTPALVCAPDLSSWQSPTSIAPRGPQKWKWLDESMFVYSSRRLGGSAKVMDLLYQNQPSGFSKRGVMLDGWIHQLPASRAVRFRSYAVHRALDQLPRVEQIVSLPCGTARDLLGIECAAVHLVDMDPAALKAALLNVPNGTIFEGSFADLDDAINCDVFIYCGLSEYLGDNEVVAQLRHIRRLLGTDGTLISSTTQAHAQVGMMSDFVGWHTRTRSLEIYRGLLELAGFRIEEEWSDPNGVQVVFTATVLETF